MKTLILIAIDLPKLRKFYQSLGWEETEISSDNYCAFKTAGVIFSLYPLEELAKDAGVDIQFNKNTYKNVTLAINVDTSDDVNLIINKVRELGAYILREPSDAFWGGRTAYFSDPENNLWEVAWNPNSVFDDRGAMISF